MRRFNVWYRFAGRRLLLVMLIAGVSVMGLSGCQIRSLSGGSSARMAGSGSAAQSMPVASWRPAEPMEIPHPGSPNWVVSLPPVPIRTPEEVLQQRERQAGHGIRLVSAIFPLASDGQSKPVVNVSISDSPNIPPVLHRVDWTGVLAAARELETNGKLPEAIQSFQPFLGQTDAPAAVYHRLGVLYDKTGQEDLAVPMYKRALELGPDNADLLCDLGYRRQMMGDNLTARQYYQKALSVDSQHARTHNHVAVLLLNNGGDEDLVMDHFRKAGLSWFQAKQNIRYIQASRKAE